MNEHIIDGVLRREPAIEFIRAREVNLGDHPDPEVLEYAAVNGYVIVSHDVNTMPGHAQERMVAARPMAGLLMAQQRSPIGQIIDSLVLIWTASEAEEWQSQICFLPI